MQRPQYSFYFACVATFVAASESQHANNIMLRNRNNVEPAATQTCYDTSDSNPFVCMGNGMWCCDNSNSTCACLCDEGWKGPSCSTLDLLPIPRSSVGVPASTTGMGANWGGGVVYEGGYWHAFVGAKTDFSNGASDEFAWNHGILHLRSSTLGGDWENLGELKGINGGNFGFRVDIKAHPNGGWLLMTDGNAAGDDRYPWDERFGFIFLYSESVYGPWTERLSYRLGRDMPDGSKNWQADPSNTDNNRWDCRMADPTFVIMEDASVYIGYRGTKCCCDEFVGAWGPTGEHELETAGLLHASSWEGPFTRVGVKIFEEGSDNEDMYMWRDDKNGGIHMLMHSQRNDHYNHERRGAHAYSPNGEPDNWKLSHDEAWPTFLYYDDCGADPIVKRQRPSLVFDPETGKPSHLLTGVASSHHGLEWGDGWTVFQPVRSSEKSFAKSTRIDSDCDSGPCPVGSVGNTNGGCDRCSRFDVPGCSVVTSSPDRDRCVCKECANGNVGDFCDVPNTVASSTCPNDGWKLLPGTNDGELFRCGEVIEFGRFDETVSDWVGGRVGGWWGNCVPAQVVNNGEYNCGDNSDESTAIDPICQWPLVRTADGACKECEDQDVSDKCLPGQAVSSDTQQSCVCQKCTDGWIGNQCDVQVMLNDDPKTLAPVSTNAPTGAPVSSPTEAPNADCKSWCAGAGGSWEQKCKWAKCSLCEACETVETASPTQSPTVSPTSKRVTNSPTTSPPTFDVDDGNDNADDDEYDDDLLPVLKELVVILNTLINILNSLLSVIGTSARIPNI